MNLSDALFTLIDLLPFISFEPAWRSGWFARIPVRDIFRNMDAILAR